MVREPVAEEQHEEILNRLRNRTPGGTTSRGEKRNRKKAQRSRKRKKPVTDKADTIDAEKEKEITKVLEEAYKQDLEKDITLGEDSEEQKKRKKAEKLLKKIEEQEQEDTKLKKKGILKRKVIIKEEDLYAFKRQKGKPGHFKKEKRVRAEEKKPEIKLSKKGIKIRDEILCRRTGKKTWRQGTGDHSKALLPWNQWPQLIRTSISIPHIS